MDKNSSTIALVSIAADFRGVPDLTRPPSGLLYVGGALKKAGYDVRIFHIAEKEIDSCSGEIAALAPLCVGFSVFTGYPCYIAQKMSRKIKELAPMSRIIWGGVHPSLSPDECLNEQAVDFVVIGEGELTAVELANALQTGRDISQVRGIGYKNGKISFTTPREQIADLDEYSMDWSLVDPLRYVRSSSDYQRAMCFVTSRGCPFSCGFCYNQKFHKSKWRAHSAEFVIKKVQELQAATQITRISFDDDYFMADQRRGFKILEGLKNIGVICDWLEVRLETATVENMRRFSDLGVKTIFFGWESGSDRMLSLMNKRLTRSAILAKCEILSKFPDIKYDASAIIGFPTEKKSEIFETVDTALEISKILHTVNFNIGTYMPYPGTSLYELALSEGFSPPAKVQDWKNYDIMSPNIRLDWLKWAGSHTHRLFFRIDKYSKFLDRGTYLSAGSSKLRTIVKKLLYHLALFRLKNKVFIFPLELYFQSWWVKRNIVKDLARFKK